MLVQFTVSNFSSFANESIFSMLADRGDGQHLDHLLIAVGRKKEALVRGAALYGANGAGKSNLIQALAFAKDRIVKGSRGNEVIPVDTFRLDPSLRDKASGFEFIFQHNETTYSYGFRATRHRIEEEWLFATPHKPRSREALLFERTTGKDDKTNVTFGERLFDGERGKPFFEFVAQGTRPNQLFLTEAFERNAESVRPIMAWFREVLIIVPAESTNNSLEVNTHVSEDLTRFIGDFLREAGTGVAHIRSREMPVNMDTWLPNLPDDQRDELRADFSKLTPDSIMDLRLGNGRRYLLKKDEQGDLTQIRLNTVHKASDGSDVEFSLSEESDGTQRLTHLIPLLFSMNQKSHVIIMDEIDRRLHPSLCRRFVEAALSCGSDAGHSQIIFTTHDTNLLDLDLLRRDEIWFVEKDAHGASRMYSLVEFSIRPDLKISKGYLNGRFGAIPFLGDICNLVWIKHQSPEAIAEVAA